MFHVATARVIVDGAADGGTTRGRTHAANESVAIIAV
jgi:hypothetical protein